MPSVEFQYSVEGIPQRDTPVTFAAQFASYFPGEVANFTAEEALVLADMGVLVPPATAPGNVDIPHVTQAGSVMNCTLGNWTGEPTSYAFQWKMGAANVGTNASTYTVQAGDVGGTATCVVTATNAHGSTPAPPSNGVVVTTPSTWTAAILTGGVVDPIALLPAIEAITDGSLAITINGTDTEATANDYSGSGTLLLVAAMLGSSLGGNSVVRCVWNPATNRFTITTAATGTAATITYASAPATGTDISALCGLTAATGATLTQGTAG